MPSRRAASSAAAGGRRRERSRLALAGATAFLAGLLLYLPGLDHGFVWDDLSILMANEALGDWSKLGENLAPGFFHEPGGERLRDYWRPVVVLSHMLDRTLFGDGARGPHLVNALLHAAASLAVLLLAHVWSGSVRQALAAGLVFALHPAHVEAAAWVSGRSDLLLGLFLALALWADGRHGRGGRAGWLLASLAFFLLALLSKEVAVVFPVLVAARALLARHGSAEAGRGRARALRPAAAALALLLVYLGVRFGLLAADAPAGLPAAVDRASLFWTWWSALLAYLELLVWPARLTILHQVEIVHSLWTPRVLAGLLAFTALLVVGWRTRRRAPGAAFGIVVLLVGLAPLSNFLVPVSRQAGAAFVLAERFLYAPSIGFCLLAGWALAVGAPAGLQRLAGGRADGGGGEPAARRGRVWGWPDWAAGGLAVVLLLGLAGRSWVRIGDWSSDLTLFGAAVEDSPGSYLAHLNYAAARVEEAEGAADPGARRQGLETARRHYLAAAELAPGNHRVHYDLANLYRALGASTAAEASYRRALDLEPGLPQARINLGTLLAQKGDLEGALAEFAAAERLAPGLTAAKVNRAHVLQMLGRPREAVPLYEAALALDPGLFAARDGLRRAREAVAAAGGE